MRNRARRRIPQIRQAQNAYDEHRLCELVLNQQAGWSLISELTSSLLEAAQENKEVIVHFLSMKENQSSVFIPEVTAQRLNIVVDVMVEDASRAVIKESNCAHQLVDFLHSLEDY